MSVQGGKVHNCDIPCRGGECADEHINGLRAQLLRSEQEMQLIKSRLAEEEQEKLKARKEVRPLRTNAC